MTFRSLLDYRVVVVLNTLVASSLKRDFVKYFGLGSAVIMISPYEGIHAPGRPHPGLRLLP